MTVHQAHTPPPLTDPRPAYKPFLKWAGGKRRLLDQYEPYFPSSADHFYEPFAGSAAVFFHLRARDFADRYTLSDANDELMRVYRAVRDHVEELLDRLSYHDNRHGEKHYYKTRKLDRNGTWEKLSLVERAARMIYLNRTCFNGLWRVNSKGQFNVPMGRYRNPNIRNEERLRSASEALQGVDLDTRSFDTVLEFASPGDFIYFDPPYVPLNATSNFTAYSKDGFTQDDQDILLDVVNQLHARGCKVMLSNSDMPVVREMYADYKIITVQARRAINVKGNGRGPVNEVLVINY